LPLALVCFAGYLFCDRFAGQFIHARSALIVVKLLAVWLHYSYTWIAIIAILGWGHALLNRPFRWLPYACEAMYPWYVLHQSLLLFFAWRLLPLGLGPVAEPALVLLGTIGGCAVLHEFIICRTRWVRPLFGMNALPSRPLAVETAQHQLLDDLA
jgi:glucans biosynthesis protein C